MSMPTVTQRPKCPSCGFSSTVRRAYVKPLKTFLYECPKCKHKFKIGVISLKGEERSRP